MYTTAAKQIWQRFIYHYYIFYLHLAQFNLRQPDPINTFYVSLGSNNNKLTFRNDDNISIVDDWRVLSIHNSRKLRIIARAPVGKGRHQCCCGCCCLLSSVEKPSGGSSSRSSVALKNRQVSRKTRPDTSFTMMTHLFVNRNGRPDPSYPLVVGSWIAAGFHPIIKLVADISCNFIIPDRLPQLSLISPVWILRYCIMRNSV